MGNDQSHRTQPEHDPFILDPDQDPTKEGRQEIVGADPFLEDFQRAPYDPLYAAQAAGRLTGEAIEHPVLGRWMRVIGIIVAVAFVLGVLLGVGTIVGLV